MTTTTNVCRACGAGRADQQTAPLCRECWIRTAVNREIGRLDRGEATQLGAP